MRLLVDENLGPAVARWLAQQGHDVVSVFAIARGADDDQILQRAATENRIVLTYDKGFGEMVFRESKPHTGVVLMRLVDRTTANEISKLRRLFEEHAEKLLGNFVVVTEERIRIARSAGDLK